MTVAFHPVAMSRFSYQTKVTLICLLVAVTSLAAPVAAEHATRRAHRVRGQLIIRPKAGASPRAIARAVNRAGAVVRRRMAANGGRVVSVPRFLTAHAESELRRSGLFRSVERDYLAGVAAIPNDPNYGAQWGLPRTGVPAAWDLSLGSSSATIAVLDTGVDFTHIDLAGQLLAGRDVINDDLDPSDDHGHGTRMSGIAAAAWNNAEGIAGIAPNSPLLPVKVLGADGLGPYSAIAEGITWAADQGARVISLSLSGSVPSQALQDAVNYATASGAVCVASAGNDGWSQPVYPAATNGAVAVAAIDEFDQRPWFSNYGAWISHASPGVGILTTDMGGGYAPSTGTSPAAAFSAGVFGLLFGLEPTLTPAQAIARLEQGAFDLGDQGWDPYHGWGGVDALATLVPGEPGATPPDDTDPVVELLSPSAGSLVSGNFSVEVSANDNVGVSRVELFLDNRKHASETSPPYSFVIDSASIEPGKHKLRAYAFDAAGNKDQTKNIKILTTPGVGLLVKNAKVVGSGVRITASFVLPEEVVFDPQNDSIQVHLEGASGAVLSALATPADISSNGAKTSATVDPLFPSGGSVKFKTKVKGASPIYTLKVKAKGLDPMPPVDDILNLEVTVGTHILSQALNFRPKGVQRLVYP